MRRRQTEETFTQNVYVGDTSLKQQYLNKKTRTRNVFFPTTLGALLLQLTNVRCSLAPHSILHSSTFDSIKYEKTVPAFVMGRLKVWRKCPIRQNCFHLEWIECLGKWIRISELLAAWWEVVQAKQFSCGPAYQIIAGIDRFLSISINLKLEISPVACILIPLNRPWNFCLSASKH